MEKIKVEMETFGFDKYLFIGVLILILLSIFTFYDFAANESLPILYVIPLSGIFLLASLTYICFFTFDVVPLYRAKKYKEFVNKGCYYSFLWFVILYTVWTIIVSDDSINNHILQRVKDDLFVRKLINLLPDEIANNTKEMLFDKSKPENRYIISLFFINNLIAIVILASSSFIYGLHRRIDGRPLWFQKWIEKISFRKQRFAEWTNSHKDKLIHSFLCLFFVSYLWDTFSITYSNLLVIGLIGSTLAFFYTNMYIILYLLNNRDISAIGIIVIFLDFMLFIFVSFSERFAGDPRLLEQLLEKLHGLYIFLLTGSFIAAFVERTNRINREKINEIIQKQQAEIKALTYQIDPHFLFNSLTFIYSKSQQYSEDLAEAVLLLSEMMRYKLPKANNNSTVSLVHEIEHLEGYIRFDQLIHPLNHVDFRPQPSPGNLEIIPNLLDIFVENALKYGNIEDPINPLEIQLIINQNRLFFRVYNKKREGMVRPRASTQMGLQNARNRLNLVYPGRHELAIQNEFDSYIVLLTIDL